MNRNGEISISKLKFQQQTLTDPGQLTDKIPLDETYAGWNRQAAVKAPGGP